MPPKPAAQQIGSGAEYYNVDFTLDTQLRLAAGASHVDQAAKQSKLCRVKFRVRVAGASHLDQVAKQR